MNMVDIIAQHAAYSTWYEVDEDSEYGRIWYVGCDGCVWQQELSDAPAVDSATHVADELVKAGFGMRVVHLPLTEG